jgi:hypothetical protein
MGDISAPPGSQQTRRGCFCTGPNPGKAEQTVAELLLCVWCHALLSKHNSRSISHTRKSRLVRSRSQSKSHSQSGTMAGFEARFSLFLNSNLLLAGFASLEPGLGAPGEEFRVKERAALLEIGRLPGGGHTEPHESSQANWGCAGSHRRAGDLGDVIIPRTTRGVTSSLESRCGPRWTPPMGT